MTDAEQLAFVRRALAAFDWSRGGADKGDLEWLVGPAGDVRFFVNCNDIFTWGCADAEEITPENVAGLERAMADAAAADPVHGPSYAGTLFCARVRRLRPQGAFYKDHLRALWPLFDACGPPRAVGLGNPHPHPHPSERPAAEVAP